MKMTFKKFIKTALAGFLVTLFISDFFFGDLGHASQVDMLLHSEILKHRLHILAVPPEKIESNDKNTFIFKTEGGKELLLEEGITISPQEWVSALDLLKIRMFSSELFRVTNENFRTLHLGQLKDKKKITNLLLPMIMLAKFGAGADGKKVILYVIDGNSGNTLYSVQATSFTMQKAIEEAIVSLEKKVWTKEWRCQVVGFDQNVMIINRGERDGLHNDQKLVGYSLSSRDPELSSSAPELLTMKYGSRKGLYLVTQAGQDFSKVMPLGNAPKLAMYDILEVPRVNLMRRKKNFRARRIWDNLYSK